MSEPDLRELAPSVSGRKEARGNATLWTKLLVVKTILERNDGITEGMARSLAPDALQSVLVNVRGTRIEERGQSATRVPRALLYVQSVVRRQNTHFVRVYTNGVQSELKRRFECFDRLMGALGETFRVPQWFKENRGPEVTVVPQAREVARSKRHEDLCERAFAACKLEAEERADAARLERARAQPAAVQDEPHKTGVEDVNLGTDCAGATKERSNRDDTQLECDREIVVGLPACRKVRRGLPKACLVAPRRWAARLVSLLASSSPSVVEKSRRRT